MNCRVVALALFLGFTSATAWSAHWPSWRGPNQDNTTAERGFPTKWTRQQNVKWRAELPEAGNSSPIVWGDTVFISQALEDGKQRTVLALERSTGKVRWQEGVRYPEQEPRHKSNPHCAASPVTDGDIVVASFGSAGIAAYDFRGKQRWKADLGKQTHEWGQGSSPILQGELVIVYHGPGPFSSLYALDKRTGAKKWSIPLEEKQPAQRFDGFAGQGDGALGTFSTPLVVRAGGRDEIILPVANKVRAFAPATGRELWSVDGMNPLVYSSASFGEGTLVAMGGFFGAMIFIKPGGEGDMTPKRLVFEQRMKKHTIGSPIVKDGHVYVCVSDGFGQCYELATGRLVWEERLPSTGANAQTWSSAVLVGDVLYVVNQSGDTLLLRAAPKFELMGTNSVGELSNSTLAFSNREIFLRTHAALYCIAEPLERAGK